ncbi:type IV pilus assembly protein PilO [Clostridium cavendishii DSM 21758]|uniref:Type IV pilus assembly protein PilO n=1 Tax=Clostridium cavendishii DSM 21758 TaxID=1121302 RepID=A0A1M6LJI0_9CLOT|nr:hypothetical protein [Clostridium cavendishii]SHJ71298.1 type IV pilus assembly protein PilO [Clostridium cavendishii DSM 21758]
MKVNNREKVLLIVLSVIVICFLYYKFVFMKQRVKVNDLLSQKIALEDDYKHLKEKVESLSKYETDVKIANAKIMDKSLKFYPVVMQEKLILEIDKLLKDSNVKGNLSFSEATVNDVEDRAKGDGKNKSNNSNTQKQGEDLGKLANAYKNKADENKKPKNDDKNAKPVSVEQMKTTLSFKGTYENVAKFLELVNNYEKIIALSSLSVANSGPSQVSGTITLEYYAIPKLSDEEAEYMKWTETGNYGKANPFAGSGKAPKTVEDATKAQNDFVMSLRNVNSDIPAFMMGKANDANRTSYIYNDTNKAQNIEITVTKKNDKYYYKYKNEKSTYPTNYKELGTEFTPVGDRVVLKVISTERMDVNDSVSAVISVVNETDKSFEVVIENDDRKLPRVKVEGKKGAVTYTNN